MARASTYTDVIGDEIVARLSEGEPLRAICRDEHMPGWVTVYAWIKSDKAFGERIACARILGHDAIAEDCIAIAEDGSNDWMERLNSKGEVAGWMVNGEAVQRSKLRVDTRLKLLAKWSNKYSDKSVLALTGADGGPVQFSNEERAAKLRALMAVAAARKAGDSVDDLV